MSTHLSSRNAVTARKPHRCDLCGERIQIGTLHDTRTGVEPGDGFWTMRMHPECHRYEQHGRRKDWRGNMVRTVDPDWYEDIVEPAFDRADVHAYELAQLNPPTHDLIDATMYDCAAALYAEHRRLVEDELMRRILLIEGRAPTSDEIKAHGARGVYPDGKTEWKWRGQTVLWELPPFYRPLELTPFPDTPIVPGATHANRALTPP